MPPFHRSLRSTALAAVVMTLAGTTAALAVCGAPATQLTGDALSATLGGKTVCVGGAGTWTNQEFHAGSAGGDIIDYKKGPGDRIDPSATIGSWSIAGAGRDTVSYNYGTAAFSYTIWQQSNGSLDFCNGSAAIVSGATVRNGLGPC